MIQLSTCLRCAQDVIDPVSGYTWAAKHSPMLSAELVFNAVNMWVPVGIHSSGGGGGGGAAGGGGSVPVPVSLDLSNASEWAPLFPLPRKEVKVPQFLFCHSTRPSPPSPPQDAHTPTNEPTTSRHTLGRKSETVVVL